MADYDILENWEGPTTENKDWRKKLNKGIREDLSEGMIESPIADPDWLDLDEWIPDDYADITRLIANSVGGGLAHLTMFPAYAGKGAWNFGATEGGIGKRSMAFADAIMSMPEYEQIFKNKIGAYTPDNLERYENAEYW